MEITSDLIKTYYPSNIYPVITKITLNKLFNNIDIEYKIYSLLFNNKNNDYITYNEIKRYELIIIRLSKYIINNYSSAAFCHEQKNMNNKIFNTIINTVVYLLNKVNSNNYIIINNDNDKKIIIQYKFINNYLIKYEEKHINFLHI